MSISVGTLIIDLQAETASFVSGMDKAGQISLTSAAKMRRAFEEMGKAVTEVLLGIEAGLAAMVEESLNNASRLEDLAQSTGTTTAALSALEYAAKQSGVGAESLDRAIEKMDKSMLKAAESPSTASNAFKTLGIAVTDAGGRLRPTQDVLEDLAQRFSTMPDGPTKTALAMQIFGKAGAEIVPLLNRGKEGITELMEEAQKLGIVIDDKFAEDSKRFEESMNRIKATAQGAMNSIAKESLPYINTILDNVSAGAGNAQSRFHDLAEAAGFMTQAFVIGFSKIQTFFDELGVRIEGAAARLRIFAAGTWKEIEALATGHWSEIAKIDADGANAMEETWRSEGAAIKKLWDDSSQAVQEYLQSADNAAHDVKKPASNEPPPAQKTKDSFEQKIQDRINKLKVEADAEANLAEKQKGSNAETVAAIASAQAQKNIDELNALAKEHKVAALTKEQEYLIQVAAQEKAFATQANETIKQLADEASKTDLQTRAFQAMADAYGRGAIAIQQAELEAKLEPARLKVQQLQQAFAQSVANMGIFASATQKLAAALRQAENELNRLTVATEKHDQAEHATNTEKLLNDLEQKRVKVERYTQALLGGADAVRQFNINQQVEAFKNNKAFDQEQIDKYRGKLELLSDDEQKQAALEILHSAERYKDIQAEIDLLTKNHAEIAKTGEDKIALEAKIHGLELQKQQDLDKNLLQTQSVGNGFKAFFDHYKSDGTTAAQKVHDMMNMTMSGITDNLAKALTGQQTSWANFFQSLEADMLKMVLSNAFKQLFSLLSGGGIGNGGGFGGFFKSVFGFGGPRADGGGVNPGQFYLVGEHGPEYFTPQSPGTIIPPSQIQAAPQQRAPTITYVTVNVSTPDADSFRKSQSQIMAEVQRAASLALARSG